jgi:hypothetical protein
MLPKATQSIKNAEKAQRHRDANKWQQFDTYCVMLEAAWSADGTISTDASRLMSVLRGHLEISLEEHWLICALLKQFPKEKCALHTLKWTPLSRPKKCFP